METFGDFPGAAGSVLAKLYHVFLGKHAFCFFPRVVSDGVACPETMDLHGFEGEIGHGHGGRFFSSFHFFHLFLNGAAGDMKPLPDGGFRNTEHPGDRGRFLSRRDSTKP